MDSDIFSKDLASDFLGRIEALEDISQAALSIMTSEQKFRLQGSLLRLMMDAHNMAFSSSSVVLTPPSERR